jgi:hypothetical protein
MKKFDLPLFSDTLFTFLCSWTISLCVLRYYGVSLILAIFLATLLALMIGVGVFLLLYRNHKKKFLSRKDKEEMDKLILHLALSSDEKNRALLAPLFCDGEKNFALFTVQPLSADAVAEKIKQQDGEPFTLFCNALTAEAQKLCEDFSVTVKTSRELYAALKEQAKLPERYICGERKKQDIRFRLHRAVRKQNARAFLTSGLTLSFLSLFSFFPLYYLISGVLLLLAALVIRLFGYA